MRLFLAPLVLALCLYTTIAKATTAAVDVCDVQNNDAADDACSMKSALGGSQVFPQLLDTFSPQGALYVHYYQITVGGAQQLAPNRVASKPSLSMAFLRGPQSIPGKQMLSKSYVVICIDFQPKTKVAKPIWLQSGMKVNPNNGAMSSTLAPIIPYQAPNPQPGTGTHDYVFLVFAENSAGLWATIRSKPQARASIFDLFNLKAFRAQTGLNNLVAGSFFKSTHP